MLARLATEKTKSLRDDYELEDDDIESQPFLLAEALEHLEEVEALSEEGRERLAEFRDELRALRVEARRPVGEFLGEVIRRIGILDELDADPDRRRGMGARRNLAAFLDEVHAFQPVEGELTLRVFLDHVDAVERLDKQEWAPVQPSDADSVKVMTIHVAKGLEFDHVFVPGFAHELLPNPKVPQNPAERGKSLDFELRGDADILPRYEGNLSAFRDALKAQEIIEERRTAYVALTRARKTLDASGSYWYGDNIYPKKESRFLNELMAWAADSGLAAVEADATEPGEENPMLGLRERFVRDWPGPALARRPIRCSRSGWRPAALEPAEQTGLIELLEPAARASFEALAADRVQLATHLRERETAEGLRTVDGDRIPRTLSASSLMDHARCPKQFYWTRVRPLPRFSGPAARIGTEIHRWIERRASGQGRLLEADDAVDLTQEELAGDPGRMDRLRQAFLTSRFADRAPLFAERAFLLRVGGFAVSGRIDAIYGEPDGPWEIVDWKTGVGAADPLQLELYGLACVEIWHKAPEDLTLTYYYLARDEAVSQPMGEPRGGARTRPDVVVGDRHRRVRTDAGAVVRLLRLQGVLRDRPRLARRQRLARTGVEPLELLVEGTVAGRGVVAAGGETGHEPRRKARVDARAGVRDGAEPFEAAGLHHHVARGAEAPARGIVDRHRGAPEGVGEQVADRCVIGGDGHLGAVPHRRGDGGLLLVLGIVELDLHGDPEG